MAKKENMNATRGSEASTKSFPKAKSEIEQKTPDVCKVIPKLKTSYGKTIPPISNMVNYVTSAVIGQDGPVTSVVTAIYRSMCMNIKDVILVIGGTGTGKSEILKQIANKMGVPYTMEDTTEYTKAGYIGANVQDIIEKLVVSANYDFNKAQYGCIFLDEIDKKVSTNKEDIAGTEVLKSLLKFVEGKKMILNAYMEEDGEALPVEMEFDTSHLTIVFSGAFEGLDKIRDKRLKRNVLGFSSYKENEQSSRYTKKDLVEYGMPEEFVGRISTIVELNTLSEDDLIQILKRSRISILKTYKNELKKMGITYVKIHEQVYKEIASEAIKLGTGARELNNVVNYVFEKIVFDVLNSPGKFTKCELYEGIVFDNTMYKLS